MNGLQSLFDLMLSNLVFVIGLLYRPYPKVAWLACEALILGIFDLMLSNFVFVIGLLYRPYSKVAWLACEALILGIFT